MTKLWQADDAARIVRLPSVDDDKYRRGVVGIHTGSLAYPGAAMLGVEGAWRAGAGMVRYSGPVSAELILHRRPETVIGSGRVGAWVIGSGTDPAARSDEDTAELRAILSGHAPVVVDAGALDLVTAASAPLVLTPHAGEFSRLAASLAFDVIGVREDDVAGVAARAGAVVLLKGHDTIVADPSGGLVHVQAAPTWLATAGAGDVLAGVIGALIAQRPDVPLRDAVATAAWLHGRAATIAAAADSGPGRPIVALDVAEALPAAVGEVLA
ncbi:NAD(P)H-hydrate dehydratase [Microbacterium sp. ZW T5_56]|uniref:ADP-dependent NAD(P)H-hydrate dehydratase n=1 Tax=Microbacterium sp. ZW T5_56 TaxID=3378081 RepID=UPI0038542399